MITNLTTKQIESIQIDEGVIFLNYGETDERLLAPTRGGGEFAADVDRQLSSVGVRTNITTQRAPNNQSKVGRIIQYSPEIKRFYFVDKEHRTPEYDEFMREVCTFSQTGKNPHDDAPDSLAMLADELYHGSAQVEVRKRAF